MGEGKEDVGIEGERRLGGGEEERRRSFSVGGGRVEETHEERVNSELTFDNFIFMIDVPE